MRRLTGLTVPDSVPASLHVSKRWTISSCWRIAALQEFHRWGHCSESASCRLEPLLDATQRVDRASPQRIAPARSRRSGTARIHYAKQHRGSIRIMADQSNARHKPRKDGLAQSTKKAADRFRAGGQQSGKHKTRAFGVANLGRSKRSLQETRTGPTGKK